MTAQPLAALLAEVIALEKRARSERFETAMEYGRAAAALIHDHGHALLSALSDAERYQALRDCGGIVLHSNPERVDMQADALLAEREKK